MRIDAFNKVTEMYQTNNVKSAVKAKSNSFSDTLEISQMGKGYQVAKQAVARTPEVREATVNDIKQRIEAGTYNVTIQDVADKLVNHYLE